MHLSYGVCRLCARVHLKTLSSLLTLYLNSLVYHRDIFGSSSKVFGNFRKSSDVFGNFRKFSENVRERSSGLRDNFGKSSESGRKSSENRQKRRYQYVYIIKRTLHVSSKIWSLCYSWQEQYLTRSLRSLVRYCSCHSNIKFISSRHRVISPIFYIDRSVLLGTKPFVDSIRHFIQDPSGVFSVCHLCECRIV